MRSTRAITTILSSAALAVALSACTGGAGGAGGGGELDYKDSPLSKMLYGKQMEKSDEEMNAEWAADSKKIEKIIGECMTKEGFEYKPADDQQNVMMSAEDWKPDDKEWVAKYGYGAIDFPGRSDGGGQEYVDPNQKYLDSLSESERKSFEETLYGPQPTEEEMKAMESGDGSYEWDWKKAGCQGKAQHEIYGDSMMGGGDNEFADLEEAINKMYTEIYEGGALADLNAKWAACMDERGEGGFKNQADAQQSIYEKISKAQEGADPSGAEQEDFGPDNPKMKQIQKEEIALALVDLDCREKTDYRQQSLKKQFELEDQFIKEHKAELEQYKAYLEKQ